MSSFHSTPKRARYFRRRSASLTERFCEREFANSARPASDKERLSLQTVNTSASWMRSKRSSASALFHPKDFAHWVGLGPHSARAAAGIAPDQARRKLGVGSSRISGTVSSSAL